MQARSGCAMTFTGNKPPEHEKIASPFTAEDDALGLGDTAEALEVMSAIHSGPDGYITLASQQEGIWKELGALEVKRLK
ncbi:MAG TPA: hypothetical protein VFO46_17200, partial [Candidatus Sulfotelmatobacter sp.]|nr:hypothetical protein [Candidatus Sulfotelmatobacter sp.]